MNLQDFNNFGGAPVTMTGKPGTGVGDYYGAVGALPKLIKQGTPTNADDMSGSGQYSDPFPMIWWLVILALIVSVRLAYEFL